MESFSPYSQEVRVRVSSVEKKLWGSKNPEYGLFKKSHPIKKETYFFVLFQFLLHDNSYFCLVLRIQDKKWNRGHKIINLAAKVLIFITSKLIDLAT